ncbi:MAG: periplasmic heavy metal sensor [Syntrophobacterales bacterium]|jgi:Spy/CpxP family protein refolding chaperone|nr:periplasmic heavy metal sensor [Syntrophobacterales bacterium]
MIRKTNFWLALFLAAALLVPALGQAQEKPGAQGKAQWQQLLKNLNLDPDKAKSFQAIEEKYGQIRQDLTARIKQNEDNLEKAMGAAQPDDAKLKESVAKVIAGHNQLFESFKHERQEEMALLTPMQQAKFLLELKKWHQEMCDRYQEKK